VKKFPSFIVALTIAGLFAGCGGGNGVRFSDLFDDSAAAEGTGIQFTGLARAVVILATHDATARQRQVAEQNGRRAVAKLQSRVATQKTNKTNPPRKKNAGRTVSTGQSKPTSQTAASAKREPGVVAAPELEPEARPAFAEKSKPQSQLPRVIAIATEKDEHTDRKAAKAIMLFDTHSQKIIGNKVYDIESEPRPGEDVRFETHSTSYIGASL
jgi:hypothetical protein